MLTALMVAAVVCIASSNGGTTSQDLKTGFLVGATPNRQQLAIIVGAMTSALVIGVTMLALNAAGTHYTKNVPNAVVKVPADAPTERPGKPYNDSDNPKKFGYDGNEYRVVHVRKGEYEGVNPGRYLVDEGGRLTYRTDVPINRKQTKMDDGTDAPKPFDAPQPALFQSIIEGILGGTLEWGLVIIGALIAISLELAGVPALPFAVGMYIPFGSTTPIFFGGLLRWLADRARGASKSEAETETSSGVLLASGYIAGGTLAGLLIAFTQFSPDTFAFMEIGKHLGGEYNAKDADAPKIVAIVMFLLLGAFLLKVGASRTAATPPPDEH
jgi:hypothetical protein